MLALVALGVGRQYGAKYQISGRDATIPHHVPRPVSLMRLVLLKSIKFANQAGFYLHNGRWHAINKDKPAPKGVPTAAHPHAAGKPVKKETLADHEWEILKLPESNTNAGTFNKQLDQLKAAATAGDVTGIVASGFGSNTYGKKLAIIANHVLELLGSEHKVVAGQKAGSHAAVQTAPEIKAEAKPDANTGDPAANTPEPTTNTQADQPAASVSAETVPAPSPKGEASSSLSMPEFAEGKQTKGVKDYYEKTANKILAAAEAGDLAALQSMPSTKGNTWQGKTENSKKLMALHQAAIAQVQAGAESGKPEQKPAPEPEKVPEKQDASSGATPISLNGFLMNDSGSPKTFANKTQAQKAADKLKEQGYDAHVTPQHPFKVKVDQAETGVESKKDDALNAAIDHLKEDAKQADLPKAEQKEDQDLVSKLQAAVDQPAQKPADEKPSSASEKLAQIPWDKMLLPDSNTNAKSHNAKVAQIKAMAEAGDIEGLKAFKAGVNTYGKKQNLLAQTALAALEEAAATPDPHANAEPSLETKTKTEQQPGSKPVKPTGLGGWDKIADSVEEAINYGDVENIKNEIAKTDGMVSPGAKAVNEYAKAGLAYVESSSSDKGKADDNSGPQEGETKEGADGMLVFHNGRWHKQGDEKAAAEKPAPSGPADVEIPPLDGGLTEKQAKAMNAAARALKAKIVAEGKAGFKGVVTNHKTGHVTVNINGIKIGKASIASKTPAFANFAKFVDELKAAAGSAPKPKAAPKEVKPDAVAAQAPEPAQQTTEQTQQLESMDSWTQTGGQGGSNPGGKFKDHDGVEWYCKFPPDEEHAKAEVLAAKLYTAMGINAQDAKLITKNGKIGIASRWQDVSKVGPAALAKNKSALAGFAADAWLANWDVVGMAFDNLQVDAAGNAMRVDAGGSLMFRAQGGKKAFGEHVTELDSMRDAALSPQAAAVFGKMTKADITASVAKVAALSDAQIRIIVNTNGPGSKEERKALAETLIARKNDLLSKFPKAAKKPKKRLDPENLPVKDDQLPKRHDFANWNGPSQPLSSKAHVNEANQAVENEMLAIAKSGNLTKLKDYKFQPVDKDSGQPVGEPKSISEHPSKHVVQYHSDLMQLLDEIANPPQPLKIFQESDVNTLDELEMAFPPKKFGTTVSAVHSNEKLGFWVVLGGVHGAEKFIPKKVMNFSTKAIESAYSKFKEASKLAKHFVHSVQSSGSYNDLFRDGKEFDHSGNKLSDVAKAALEFATEQPAGTSVYRWQNMSDDMVKKVMSAPEGSVFQATGPMCTSYSPTATQHFGKHRVHIVYAKGAKAVESFGSGGFANEKEVTTLPNARFVVLKREMVPNEKGSGERLELQVLMLPPDLGL